MTQEQQGILDLELLVQKLLSKIDSLEKEVRELKGRLSKYETPKNSNNSSVPPSKDENRPRHTQSLREPTGRKPGGQPGHKGTTLEMTAMPDLIEKHQPIARCECGQDLSSYPLTLSERRQIIDLPVIKPIITEHQIYKRVCSCGRQHTGVFPEAAKPGICYGVGVDSLAGYLHARQYLPLDRMRELFNNVLQVPISEGGLQLAIKRMAKKALPIHEEIRKEVESSAVVGTDETGSCINGIRGWFWTWQTQMATFIGASMNRGTKTINQFFPNGFSQSVFVHDCWKSHFEPEVKTHQICIAHLLRELKYFDQRYKDSWSGDMRALLLDALELKKTMTNPNAPQIITVRNILDRRLNSLLGKKIPDDKKEMEVFQQRLVRYQQYLFVFLDRLDVPPDNNGSERAIRNIKVKQKISGYFKTMQGAEVFAILRSVTDTALKKNQNILAELHNIALT